MNTPAWHTRPERSSGQTAVRAINLAVIEASEEADLVDGLQAVACEGHPDGPWGGFPEAMPFVEPPPGNIRQQVHIGILWGLFPNGSQEGAQHRVTQAPPLVGRQDSHVHHVEIPTAVTDDPSHRNRLAGCHMPDVDGLPAAGQCRNCLIQPPGCQPSGRTQVHVVSGCGRALHQKVFV